MLKTKAIEREGIRGGKGRHGAILERSVVWSAWSCRYCEVNLTFKEDRQGL